MNKLNKLICRIFGCKMHEEVWANKNVRLRDPIEIRGKYIFPTVCKVCDTLVRIDEAKRESIITDSCGDEDSEFDAEWDCHCPVCGNKLARFEYGIIYDVKPPF